MLSVILPSYNEEGMIKKTVGTLTTLLTEEKVEFELVFVNDGSRDNTQLELEKASEQNAAVRYVMFSRNFGKEAAIFAGLAAARGNCVTVMDCDLQHPPATLVEMYRLWEQGYEVVEGVKRTRGRESVLHRLCAGTFYGMMTRATGIDMTRASDFKLLDRRAVDTLLSMPEYHVFFRALSSWIGYKTARVEFDVQEREAGTSKWSASDLIRYALNNIAEYSAAPLYVATWLGVIFFLAAVIMGGRLLLSLAEAKGMDSLTVVIFLQLLIGSILMLGIGIAGFYLAKIYDEVKKRPRYIISKMK